MRILFIGDVVGEEGCMFLQRNLYGFRRTEGIDFVIANGENSGKNNGLSAAAAQMLFGSGVDFLTGGNHIYKDSSAYSLLDDSLSVIRPLNYPSQNPGVGYRCIESRGLSLCVINLAGNAFMGEVASNPFDAVDELLKKIDKKVIIVDFHAEATSEKCSMGYFLDGRVSAVIGTHTHVQTADERILPGGTAYMTDAGMTGPIDSVLGIDPKITIAKHRTGMPSRFVRAGGPCKAEGCVIEIDDLTGKAASIERIRLT